MGHQRGCWGVTVDSDGDRVHPRFGHQQGERTRGHVGLGNPQRDGDSAGFGGGKVGHGDAVEALQRRPELLGSESLTELDPAGHRRIEGQRKTGVGGGLGQCDDHVEGVAGTHKRGLRLQRDSGVRHRPGNRDRRCLIAGCLIARCLIARCLTD